MYHWVGFEYLPREAVSITIPIYITRSHSLLRKSEAWEVFAASKKNRYGVTTLLNPQRSLAITDLFLRKVTLFILVVRYTAYKLRMSNITEQVEVL